MKAYLKYILAYCFFAWDICGAGNVVSYTVEDALRLSLQTPEEARAQVHAMAHCKYLDLTDSNLGDDLVCAHVAVALDKSKELAGLILKNCGLRYSFSMSELMKAASKCPLRRLDISGNPDMRLAKVRFFKELLASECTTLEIVRLNDLLMEHDDWVAFLELLNKLKRLKILEVRNSNLIPYDATWDDGSLGSIIHILSRERARPVELLDISDNKIKDAHQLTWSLAESRLKVKCVKVEHCNLDGGHLTEIIEELKEPIDEYNTMIIMKEVASIRGAVYRVPYIKRITPWVLEEIIFTCAGPERAGDPMWEYSKKGSVYPYFEEAVAKAEEYHLIPEGKLRLDPPEEGTGRVRLHFPKPEDWALLEPLPEAEWPQLSEEKKLEIRVRAAFLTPPFPRKVTSLEINDRVWPGFPKKGEQLWRWSKKEDQNKHAFKTLCHSAVFKLPSLNHFALRGVDLSRVLKDPVYVELFNNFLEKLNIVRLELPKCKIGAEVYRRLNLTRIEELDLSGDDNIEDLSFLSQAQALKALKLEGCVELKSLKGLENVGLLKSLNLKNCSGLEDVSALSQLASLAVLNLEGCSQLKNVDALQPLTGLKVVGLSACTQLSNIDGLNNSSSLTTLLLRDCKRVVDFGILEKFSSLKLLDLSGCDQLEALPSLTRCTSLDLIDLRRCSRLARIRGLSGLTPKILLLRGCERLTEIQGSFLSSLEFLDLGNCESLTRVSICSGYNALRILNLNGCKHFSDMSGLKHLIALEQLDLSGCNQLNTIEALQGLTSLKYLNIKGCDRLTDLSVLKDLTSLEELNLTALTQLSDISPLASLPALEILLMRGCNQLEDIDPLGALNKLEQLDLSNCTQLKKLPTWLPNTPLTALDLTHCSSLETINGLEHLVALKKLSILECSRLAQTQESLSPLKGLEHIQELHLNTSIARKNTRIINQLSKRNPYCIRMIDKKSVSTSDDYSNTDALIGIYLEVSPKLYTVMEALRPKPLSTVEQKDEDVSEYRQRFLGNFMKRLQLGMGFGMRAR